MKYFNSHKCAGLIAMLVCTTGAIAATPYSDVLGYTMGQSNVVTIALETEIHKASVGQMRVIEGRLIDTLQAPGATPDAQRWVLRQLRYAGTERCLPAVAPLLLKDEFSTEARIAVQGIAGAAVDQMLREALGKAQGRSLAGLLQTIGSRGGDRAAVPSIQRLIAAQDEAVVDSALFALGRTPDASALSALKEAKVPQALARARWQAILSCAQQLSPAESSAACEMVFKGATEPIVKVAAIRGWMLADPIGSKAVVLESLKGNNVMLRTSTARFLCELNQLSILGNQLSGLAGLPSDVQVAILSRLQDPSALPAVAVALKSPEDAVRFAAVEAMGRLGDATSVPGLLQVIESGDKAMQAEARASLLLLKDKQVDATLVELASNGKPAQRGEALQVLSKRSPATALTVALKSIKETDPVTHSAGLKTLGTGGSIAHLPAILDALIQAKDAEGRGQAEESAIALSQRVSPDEAAKIVISTLDQQRGEDQVCSLLRILGQVQAPGALQVLKARLQDTGPAVKSIALNALAEWNSAAPMADMLQIVKTSPDGTAKTIALRGYIRMGLNLPSGPAPAAGFVQGLKEAMIVATADQKKLIVGALGAVPHASAAELALGCLAQPELEVEAAAAAVAVAKKVQKSDPDAAADIIERVLDTAKNPAARKAAEGAGLVLNGMVNIASQGVATSPDDLEKDGQSGGDAAAIDGNPATYWDKQDGAKLYRLLITFKQPEPISAISILGFKHQDYAPKDFEIRCDGKTVKTIQDAKYDENYLVVPFAETSSKTVELYITGYYGASPAIRELGIYRKGAVKKADYRILIYSKTLGFRHTSIEPGIAAIRKLGKENGFAVTATEDSSVFTRENLARFKAVAFLSVTGDVLNELQEAALKEYVTGGGGFAAIHGALHGKLACEGDWPWYGELVCATFANHSAVVLGRVDVEDSKNPSTIGLPERWFRTDEWYNYTVNPRGRVRVVASVDESTYQGGTLGADHPISWCSQMGQGKVWYTAMGHTDSSFSEPLLMQHILGGIQLVAGVKTGDFSANAAPKKAAATGLTVDNDNGSEWSVRYNGQPICVYKYVANPWKPYMRELRTLRGENILRDSPDDHKHHHALMYAIRVNDVNFWEEVGELGMEKPIQVLKKAIENGANGRPQAVFSQRLLWVNGKTAADAKTEADALLVEDRTLFISIDERTSEVALRWQGKFKVGGAAGEKATLTGATYHGLGVRFLQTLDEAAHHDVGGKNLELAGSDQDLTKAPWGAIRFTEIDKPSTFAIFGSPQNARGDSVFFSMKRPFAYLAATQGLDKEPLVYKPGETWTVDYLVTVYPDAMSSSFLNDRAARFAKDSAKP